MYGFLISIGVVLLIMVIGMVYRIQTLISVAKGSDKKIATTSNKVNAILFMVFLIGCGAWMVYYSVVEFDNYQLPIASEHGVVTDRLFWITMAVTGFIFILTHILLFWFSYHYQYKENKRAAFYPDNNKLEIIWTLVPAVVLTVLVISGWKAWSDITSPAPDNAHVVEIMGYQFAWDVRYPGADQQLGDYDYRLTTATNSRGIDFTDKNSFDDFPSQNVVIPKGEPVLFNIRARDVLHSVFAPHMRLKMDAVPGMPTRFWFTPNKTTEEMRAELGDEEFEFEIACTEICGAGHFSMRKVIKVVEPEEYRKWFAEQTPFIKSNPDLVADLPVELKELAEIYINEE
ncbi:cytochrome c oxidase subunit II [Cyclobacterium marinum]|uniref:Cytochrome c oxidase subunit 2 n=1 Tax=Cyclobacterium marinum (strain ATCC 25205 / DSM 745 / LMG 13164 / NCIMB 1802) TaxID=880070 RepID=G0J535_CYCMS|nr:cytochrome c oxidase subunit II [Cyclobacterium marinum]AEL26029.1 cytochrome c oxidase subunit II [Cyclobacterium marinum DSM 745]MBR9774628.1 cytochrome c oxidase subunit II [Cytophagales bacterium]|tara:strand:- start:4576 stop:5607 length:1032 start_codon:yes stop_codon:yes gene_type:complete